MAKKQTKPAAENAAPKSKTIIEADIKTACSVRVLSDGILFQQGGVAARQIKCDTPVKITIESC